MGILKVLDREFRLYIEEIEELQSKVDSLLVTSRFLGYKIRNLYIDRGDKKESFFFTSDNLNHFLIEIYLDEDGVIGRVNWAVANHDTVGMKVANWSGVLEEELVGLFDELVSYI